MPESLRVDRILGDRPFAEIGDPVLAVADEHASRLAVAGRWAFGFAPVGVYGLDDRVCRAVVRSRYPVNAAAFHPTLPLLAVGTGRYDGGYFFEGELLLLDEETGAAVSGFEDPLGRQVLALEWLTDDALRLIMAPYDDWDDKAAWSDGHVAVVRRSDWRARPFTPITGTELAGPRGAAPRADHAEDARRTVSALAARWRPRRDVRVVTELADGRVLAALDGVMAECWDPSGAQEWVVPDDNGGRDLVVSADGASVWVSPVRPPWEEGPQSLVKLSVDDGSPLEHLFLPDPVTLVECVDGVPAVVPAGGRAGERGRLRIRRGSRMYCRDMDRDHHSAASTPTSWLAAADLPASPTSGQPRQAAETDFRRLMPYSWVTDETHFAGPGVETSDGSLVYAGTIYNGAGLQPGGSFVVRRDMLHGTPRWDFRTDRPATDLDADPATAYVAYDDGEIVALDLETGLVRWRYHLTINTVSAVPTALTSISAKRLLIGTSDGRILDCSFE